MIVYRTLHWWAVQLEWSEYLLTFAWTRGEQEGKVHWCWSLSAMPSQAFVIARCISLFSPTTLVVLVVVRALGMLLATTHQ